MTSYLFRGKLMHARRDRVHHTFVYSVYMLLLDLDDLPQLDRELPLFAHNRRGAVALYDADHLPHPDGSTAGMKAMALARLAAAGVDPGEGGKIYMLTNPRIAGYTFNPLTIYYCCDASGQMIGALAEVSNTFGDQHPYVMSRANEIPTANAEERRYCMRRFAADKVFFVSPWIPMDARYEISLSPIGSHMIVHIDEFRKAAEADSEGAERFFQARLWGDIQPLTAKALRGALIRYPFLTFKIVAAIHWEGIVTHLKGARFVLKRAAYRASPPDDDTVFRRSR
jgi:DUF1365 family protein